jgi:cystathionine beta-lyase
MQSSNMSVVEHLQFTGNRLLMRGMKTLAVRLEKSQSSAGELAGWLLSRPEVDKVLYPGLSASPNFSVHKTQAKGAGAILSFRLTENVDVKAFLESLEIWTLAVSLGAVESIITQPACMTHLTYPEEERKRLGIDRQLIRLSVGIEAVADLIDDLAQALDRARS